MATEHKLSGITWVAMVLAVIGALNWGIVGLFNFNVINKIFGDMSTLSRVIYVVVGLAGLYLIADAARLREEHRGLRKATVT